MKRTPTIKNILGLTQEEMAMVLGISKSHWAMFATGKRDIPLAAKQNLTVLLQVVQKGGVSKATEQFLKAEREKTIAKLKLDYLKVQIKQHRIEKEISTLENHRSECFAALEVAAYMEHKKEKTALAANIKARALKTLNKYSQHMLEQLQLQKGNLVTVKAKIEKKIKTLEA